MTTLLVLARAFHIGSALLLAGLFFFQHVILRSDFLEERGDVARCLRRWTVGSFFVQLLSGTVWFWIVAANLNDTSLLGALDPGLLGPVLEQTQFGELWSVRIVLVFVFGMILLFPKKSGWFDLIVSSLLLLSLAWAGHAAAGVNYQGLHIGVDAAHLAIVAIWPVGLVPLAILLIAGAKEPREALIAPLCRFSGISFFSVMLLLATGIANALFFFPNLESLFATTYGRLLLGKIGLFLLMIGFSAMNRYSFLPELRRDFSSIAFDRLRRSVLAETFICFLILLIVGVMGMTPPPF